MPVGASSRHITLGGHLSASLGYRLFERVVLQAEYLYSTHGVAADFLEGDGFSAVHMVHGGILGLEVDVLPRGGPVELYLVGGGGIYGRSVEIGVVTGGEIPEVCEPGLLICATGVAPFPTGLAKGTVVGFGAQGGIGASISLGTPVRLFLEARFHYVWGTIGTPDGPRAAHGRYLPLTLGFRFF